MCLDFFIDCGDEARYVVDVVTEDVTMTKTLKLCNSSLLYNNG